VVASLLDASKRAEFDAANRAEQEKQRALHGAKRERPLLALADARARRLALDFRSENLPEPAFLGPRVVDDVSLADLVDYIDWTFFFAAWELKGRFPKILDHPEQGAAARELYEHGRALLERLIAEGRLRARAVYGFWPAAHDGDDLVLYGDAGRSAELARFPMLRQQQLAADGRPTRCLADYVAPAGSGLRDHVGAFALTAGLGADELAAEFERAHDPYHSIMVKALADRLAEAYAELLHQRARRDWGYGRDEALSPEDLIDERYRGIRPAFGYPACPDHSEKRTLFRLLDAPSVGISLTESCAMHPAASVSGLYFAHPEARYFAVGRIGRDQLEDYARRKHMELAEAERWLAPNL
jgi:5-methyltetrahydrofolate--homocysteine methyltransferase